MFGTLLKLSGHDLGCQAQLVKFKAVVAAAALANVIWPRLIGMGRTRIILFNIFMLMSEMS